MVWGAKSRGAWLLTLTCVQQRRCMRMPQLQKINNLEKEMSNYLNEINKIKKQREKIDKKIKEEAIILEKINELRKNQNFKSKVII